MMHFVEFVEVFDFMSPAMTPVKEEVLHEEDQVRLEEDFPVGGEPVESQIDADYR